MKSAARQLTTRGFAVFPCSPFSKIPANENGLRGAVTTHEGVEELWGKRRWLNVAIATGTPSGVFVVDVDGPQGAAALAAMERAHGPLPPTLESATRNGRHLFFAWPGQRVPTSQGQDRTEDRHPGRRRLLHGAAVHPSLGHTVSLDRRQRGDRAGARLARGAGDEGERTPPVRSCADPGLEAGGSVATGRERDARGPEPEHEP